MATISILGVVLIILSMAASFAAGFKLSDYSRNKMDSEIKYALEKQYVRLQAGSDADDPCQPYVNKQRIQLPPEFDNRLKTNGQATMMVGNSNSKKQQR